MSCGGQSTFGSRSRSTRPAPAGGSRPCGCSPRGRGSVNTPGRQARCHWGGCKGQNAAEQGREEDEDKDQEDEDEDEDEETGWARTSRCFWWA